MFWFSRYVATAGGSASSGDSGRRLLLPGHTYGVGAANYGDPELVQGGEALYCIDVSSSAVPLTATLVWTDPPGYSGTTRVLVHDLDLIVEPPEAQFATTASRIYGNNGYNSLPQSRDTLNNVEQVVIPAPQPGRYQLRVHAPALVVRLTQPYALVVTAAGSIVGGACSECGTQTLTADHG